MVCPQADVTVTRYFFTSCALQTRLRVDPPKRKPSLRLHDLSQGGENLGN